MSSDALEMFSIIPFNQWKSSGVLDITNPVHMFILHYVYLPRINAAIENLVDAWNKHPIRTERNCTPEQIWSNGMTNWVSQGG